MIGYAFSEGGSASKPMRSIGIFVAAFIAAAMPSFAQELPVGAGFLTLFSGTAEVETGGTTRTVIDTAGTTGSVLDFTEPDGPPAGRQWQYPPELFRVTAAETGQVFGVALDDAPEPNIYLTATSAFGLHRNADGSGWMDGMWGDDGGPGTVYRLAAYNGYAPEVFARITLDGRPNSGAALGNIAYDPDHGQFFVADLETGMIHRLRLSDGFDLGHYDHGLDGRAAFFDAATGLSESLPTVAFDPASSASTGDCPSGDFARDPSCWNVADFRRRVWGLAVRTEPLGGAARLFYSVWSSQGLGNPDHFMMPDEWRNTIWSVGLTGDGEFDLGDVRREATLPDFFRDPAAIGRAGYSHPVTDIAFPSQGDKTVMLVAERGGLRNRGLSADDAFAMRQESRVLQYRLDADGVWRPDGRYDVAYQDREFDGPPYIRAGAAGGVAFGIGHGPDGALDASQPDAFVWMTGDGLCAPEGACRDAAGDLTDVTQVHGLQGSARAAATEVEPAEAFQPYPAPGPATPPGGPDASYMIDADLGRDGDLNDATRIGDIAIYQDTPAFVWEPGDYPWWPIPDPDPGAPDLQLVKTGPAYCDWAAVCDFLITVTNNGPGIYDGPIHVADYIDPGFFLAASPDWICDDSFGAVPLSCWHDAVTLAPGDSLFLVLTFQMPMVAGPLPPWETEGLNCAAILWLGAFDDPEGQVLAIELALAHRGYDPGVIDSVADADTQAAIDAYRADTGLPPGGIDAELYASLYPGNAGMAGDAVPENDVDCHPFLLPGQDEPDQPDERFDLAIAKQLWSAECLPGDICEFRVSIFNDGTETFEGPLGFADIAGFEGIGPLPPDFIASASPALTCPPVGPYARCAYDGLSDVTLPPSAGFAFVIRVAVPADPPGPDFVNCSIIDWGAMGLAGDDNPGNDHACAPVLLPEPEAPQLIDLAMQKRLVSEGCQPGAECRFFIGVENNGDEPFMTPVVWGDYLDMAGAAGLPPEVLSSEFNAENCTSYPGGSMRCTLSAGADGLDPGNDLRDRAIVLWPEGLPVLRNCAAILWDEMGMPEGDADPSNDEVCVELAAPVIPPQDLAPVMIDLSITKSAPDACEQGASCVFDITIANNGPGDFTGPLFVADELSDGPMGALIGASGGLSCYAISDANGFCRQAPMTLAEGDAIAVTAVWPVPGDYPPGTVENCASVGFPRAPDGEPNLLMVQAALLQAGYEVYLTNTMDPPTAGAIAAYRTANGLPPGSAVDDGLLDALFGDAGGMPVDRIAANNQGCDTFDVVEAPASQAMGADLAVHSQTECVRGETCTVEAWIENEGDQTFTGVAGMRGRIDPALAITSLSSQHSGFICAATGEASYECLGARLTLAPAEQARVQLMLDVPADFGPDVVMHIKEMIWPDASVKDPNAQNDSNSAPIDIVDPPEPETPPMPDIAVSKTANQGSCQAGSLCRFSVNAVNQGPGAYQGDLRITDTIQPTATLTGFSPSGWSCAASGGQVKCTYANAVLAEGQGQPLSLTFRTSSRSRGTLQNCAEVDWIGDVPVRDVQAALNDAGFNAGIADGIPGRRTQAAVRAYQQAMGLPVTGAIDANLLQSLMGLESVGDLVQSNDRACAQVNLIAPPQPQAPDPVCPGGWTEVTDARGKQLGAQGWSIRVVTSGNKSITCARQPSVTPDPGPQCPSGWNQVTASQATSLRQQGYSIRQVTAGGRSILCAKPPTVTPPPTPSCPSGFSEVSRARAKVLVNQGYEIRQVGNLLCARRRAVIPLPEIKPLPQLRVIPQLRIEPQLR